MTGGGVFPTLPFMDLATLSPEDRRRFAAHLSGQMFAPDGRLTIPFSPTETNALADLLDMLAARTAEDPTGAEQILTTGARRMATRLRDRLASATPHQPAG